MASFFVYKIRTSCTECGEGMVLEGPQLEARCEACASAMTLPDSYWKNMLSFRSEVERFALTEGKTRGSSLVSGEQRFLVSWGPQRPLCIACGALLDLTAAPPGTTGTIACACGHANPTFPPPPWLAQSDPSILQIFGAPHEASTGVPAAAQVGAPALDLVSFACPDCGANLKVTPDSARVLRCTYCQCDSYLPEPLWRALHPVKKRTPFYVAFK
jgi:hypothetical protein